MLQAGPASPDVSVAILVDRRSVGPRRIGAAAEAVSASPLGNVEMLLLILRGTNQPKIAAGKKLMLERKALPDRHTQMTARTVSLNCESPSSGI